MFKVNNKDTRTKPMGSFFIVNFEHISHFALVFFLLNLNMQLPIRMLVRGFENDLDEYI